MLFLGPDLPKPLEDHQLVNFDDTVIAIGGVHDFSSDGKSNVLFKLVCTFEECQWKEMAQKLAVARDSFFAMTIPDEMTKCRKKSQ